MTRSTATMMMMRMMRTRTSGRRYFVLQ